MGTLRQKKVAKAIKEAIENNENTTAGELLDKVGYKKISRYPKRVIESVGVKEELKAILNVEEVDQVVKSIMVGAEKDTDRLKAGDMIYKRLGSYAAEKKEISGSLTLSDLFDSSQDGD